jgi:uncharacterized damage-inducible protein DinB
MRATPILAHAQLRIHKSFTVSRAGSAKLERMETKRLASQLRRSYEGQAWHGPSLRELLDGVTSEQAAAKPVSGAHSILELVLHVTAWEREALAVVEGKKYETLAGEQDWPPVQGTWETTVAELGTVTQALVAAVRAMPEEKLNESAGGAEYHFYFLLHGVVQHNLYHAGQIAILKRAL